MSDGTKRWATRANEADVALCRCGEAWFRLAVEQTPDGRTAGVVAVDGEGEIIAYSGVLRCMACDEPWEPGGHLEVVTSDG